MNKKENIKKLVNMESNFKELLKLLDGIQENIGITKYITGRIYLKKKMEKLEGGYLSGQERWL